MAEFVRSKKVLFAMADPSSFDLSFFLNGLLSTERHRKEVEGQSQVKVSRGGGIIVVRTMLNNIDIISLKLSSIFLLLLMVLHMFACFLCFECVCNRKKLSSSKNVY